MEKIVEEVLLAEEKAKTLIEEARQKAAILKNDVELEIAGKLKLAREEAQELIKTGIQQVKTQAEQEYDAALAQVEQANTAFIEKNRQKIDGIVAEITRIITTPEFNRE